jgi:putative transposase
VYYHLYVLIDIFSRYNPGWIVSTVEECHLAADFLADAIANNGAAPHTVHADRGTSMTSKTVSTFLADWALPERIPGRGCQMTIRIPRPSTRTLKYLPDFPEVRITEETNKLSTDRLNSVT